MTPDARRSRAGGWALAAAAASLLCGAAAFALAAERQAPVLFLDLAELPPSAPAVAAVAESAPQVVDEAPPAPPEPAADGPTPDLPTPDTAPDLAAALPVTLPKADVPVTADLALPPAPEKPEPKPAKKPKPRPEKASKPKAEKSKAKETAAAKPKPVEKKPKAAGQDNAAAASAPKAGSKAKSGGGMSPAAYAKAVMKKVRSTRKQTGAGKGAVVVGFTIGDDGSLAGVKLLQGSGNAALDRVALDHIRRSAPFPPPPEGAGQNYSFEFVGK